MATPMVMEPKISANILDSLQHTPGIQRFLAHFALAPRRPALASLQQIITAFSHLPYENLSKIIKLNLCGENEEARLRLPEEVMEDHLRHRTGGTCFSLTFYLQSILMYHGYSCYVVMGDMKVGRNVHCALIVRLEGVKYLVDPGYLLHRPMALDPDKPRLYHNKCNGVELRFEALAQCYDLFTFTPMAMKWRYRFADRPTRGEEFWKHWQASFHRNSMHGLCLTRVRDEEMIFILKDFMRVTSPTGHNNVPLKRNLHHTINDIFGIAPAYVERALSALQENMARERL
jgi:arylamine N-acetyltransferase